MAILSEAYSHDPFATRIRATYDFVREVLSLLVERRNAIMPLLAEGIRTDSVAVRQKLADSTLRDVIAELTTPADSSGRSGGFAPRRQSGKFRTVKMPVWDRFTAARREAVPAAYLIPDRLQTVVELLRRQGIVVTALPNGWKAPAEAFAIDSVRRSRNRFEGHNTLTAEGRWIADSNGAAGPWYLVSTTQPLGLLAAYLLEPGSEDGVVAWNFLDADIVAGSSFPIRRLRRPLPGR